jgi:hypothetical protein
VGGEENDADDECDQAPQPERHPGDQDRRRRRVLADEGLVLEPSRFAERMAAEPLQLAPELGEEPHWPFG